MDRILKYLKCAVNFYGIISIDFFIQLYNNYTSETVKKEDVLLHLNNNCEKFDFLVLENETIINVDVYQDKEYLEFLTEASKDKPFYIPDESEFLKYEDDNYYEKFEEYDILKNYLKSNFNKGDEVLDQLCTELAFFSRKQIDITQMMNIVKSKVLLPKNPKHLRTIDKLLIKIMNKTRKWINRGHCPNEVHSGEKQEGSKFSHLKEVPVTVVKVGRNEPCSCGSGKKYKKCCGR